MGKTRRITVGCVALSKLRGRQSIAYPKPVGSAVVHQRGRWGFRMREEGRAHQAALLSRCRRGAGRYARNPCTTHDMGMLTVKFRSVSAPGAHASGFLQLSNTDNLDENYHTILCGSWSIEFMPRPTALDNAYFLTLVFIVIKYTGSTSHRPSIRSLACLLIALICYPPLPRVSTLLRK